jgi:hypothetical protein
MDKPNLLLVISSGLLLANYLYYHFNKKARMKLEPQTQLLLNFVYIIGLIIIVWWIISLVF